MGKFDAEKMTRIQKSQLKSLLTVFSLNTIKFNSFASERTEKNLPFICRYMVFKSYELRSARKLHDSGTTWF